MSSLSFNPDKLQTPVAVLYDGENVSDLQEVEFLKRNDRDSNLSFIELSESNDSIGEFGISNEEAKQQLHARDADGQSFAGLDALYVSHSVIGLGHWFEMCRLPGFLCEGTGIGPE